MPYKAGEGRPPMNISESEIRYAMENTQSCAGAARFLKVSYEAFRKYAKLYTDEASGKTLFELHKNKAGKGISLILCKRDGSMVAHDKNTNEVLMNDKMRKGLEQE